MMSDLISRQDAIDLLEELETKRLKEELHYCYSCGADLRGIDKD